MMRGLSRLYLVMGFAALVPLLGCGQEPQGTARAQVKGLPRHAAERLLPPDPPPGYEPREPRDEDDEKAEKPVNPLPRALYDSLGEVDDDFNDSQRKSIRNDLNKADRLLTEAKDRNRLALAYANRQYRLKYCDAPNIILIVADDLGIGDLGCHGQQQILTPRLDEMAAEGVRFTNYYSGSGIGPASRYSMMTGLHTGRARSRSAEEVPLVDGDITLPEVLWHAGYDTGVFGKWSLGDFNTSGIPTRHGFDVFLGMLTREHAQDQFPDWVWWNEERMNVLGNEDGAQQRHSTAILTDEAIRFIERNRRRHFFVYLPYTVPHQELASIGHAPYNEFDWPAEQKTYAALVTDMDAHIGKILDHLKQWGLENDTLVLFTSDNGPHQNGGYDPAFFRSAGDYRGLKGSLFEGAVRAPLIVWWGDSISGPRVETGLWAAWDIMPTLTEISNAMFKSRETDGISFAEEIYGGPLPRRDFHQDNTEHEYLYWELHGDSIGQAVRTLNWKAVRGSVDADWELYNVLTDPNEEDDVAGDHADVIDQINAMIEEARVDTPKFRLKVNP